MTRLAILLLTFGFAALQPGVREGRVGNARLGEGDAAGAALAYQNGLARLDVATETAAKLWHNLGLALAQDSTARMDQPSDTDSLGVSADSAFAQSLRLAAEPATRARYAYDAGTAALLAGDLPRAVALLRRSLVLDPSRAHARRNYEIARRRLRDPETPPEQPEPSEFARRLKERAERLVAEQRYREAFDLMTDGLAQDSTVAAFQDFTSRIGEVVDIEAMPGAPETTAPPAPVPPSAPRRPDARPSAPAGPTRL